MKKWPYPLQVAAPDVFLAHILSFKTSIALRTSKSPCTVVMGRGSLVAVAIPDARKRPGAARQSAYSRLIFGGDFGRALTFISQPFGWWIKRGTAFVR